MAKGDNAGRTTDYKEEYDDQAYKLCLLGATDQSLAVFFDVTETTVNNWKIKHPKFFESIKAGKEIADAEVAQSLYKKATGYDYEEEKAVVVSDGRDEGAHVEVVKIKLHQPPSDTAGIFWLKNRRPKEWREKQEIDHTTKGEKLPATNINTLSGADLDDALRAILSNRPGRE